MKKVYVSIVLALFVTVALCADFNWSAWGRGVFTPIAFSGENSAVSAASSGSAAVPRVGFSLAGSALNDDIGFDADFHWDGGIPEVGENAKIWAKPFPFLKLTIGKFNEDDMRGRISNSEFTSWIIPNGGKDEDSLFTRFQATAGSLISAVPIDGLFIGLALGSTLDIYDQSERAARNNLGDSRYIQEALDAYKAVHAGAGYAIPNIGFARVQFIGNNRNQLRYNEGRIEVGKTLTTGLTKNRDADVIEAAFQYTGLSGLNVEVGGKIPLPYEIDTKTVVYPALYPEAPYENGDKYQAKVQLPITVSIGAVYDIDNFSILVRADTAFGGTAERVNMDSFTTGFNLNVWVNPSYQIFNSLKAGLDVGMELHTADTRKTAARGTYDIPSSDYFDFGFGLWAEKKLSGGAIKAGLMCMFPGSERYTYHPEHQVTFTRIFSGEPVISIPISITYSL